MNREPGFYWVNYDNEWIVAEWCNTYDQEFWFIAGEPYSYNDKDFKDIDERQIERDPQPLSNEGKFTAFSIDDLYKFSSWSF